MLWLAGLMGLVGVGAASLAVVHTPEETDDQEPERDDVSHDGALETYGDLMDHIDAPEELDPESPAVFLLHKDFAEYDDGEELSESAFPMQGTESTELLRDIAADPFAAEMSEVDGLEEGEDPFPRDPEAPIMLGDWVMEGPPSEVLDYEAGKDSLMLVWDDLAEGAQEPQVRVEQDPFDEEVMHVIMNDKSVAEVYGDPELSVADVTVIPLSSALIVGLEPA